MARSALARIPRPTFADERAGQLDFFARFGLDATLADHTDGVYRGTLFEFKTSIDRPSRVLSQALKYLSRMRNRGKSVPAHILLIDLGSQRAYHYLAADYLPEIEAQYQGAASRANDGLQARDPFEVIDYGEFDGVQALAAVLADESFVAVHIDLYDVIGWADRFYAERPKASKVALFEELRAPAHFAGLIHPWEGVEDDFRFIMDCLNDRQHRKELGAFYTPPEYAELSAGLVRQAIEAIPATECADEACPHRFEGEGEHKHYVIVDRCAGTGNLDEPLSDEELSHLIVATYELKEWLVLNSRLGGKVRAIIPPAPDHDGGLLHGGDALAQAVFPEVAPYVEDPGCAVILLENPPYSDASGDAMQTGAARGKAKDTVVAALMRAGFRPRIKGLQPTKEIANLFIWSGWEAYLRGPHDAYVLYAPLKHWKTHGLTDRRFVAGYLLNRKHFHASASGISCILWSSEEDAEAEAITLPALDIVDGEVVSDGEVVVRKAHTGFNQAYFDKLVRAGDDTHGIHCGLDGREAGRKGSTTEVSIRADDVMGYLYSIGFALGPTKQALTRCALPYRRNGFHLRRESFHLKLPLFAAKSFPQRRWHEKDVYCTTADGGSTYERDGALIRACLVWAALSQANHCLSFTGSDGCLYRNELCFDEGTAASDVLATMTLNEDEEALMGLWREVRDAATQAGGLDGRFSYGPYQIALDINTSQVDERGARVYDHPVLNDRLAQLKAALSSYYDHAIVPRLFEHGLLK